MRVIPVLVFLLLLPGIGRAAPSPLAGHFSPYLAMHAEDPVQWRLWDDEVLQQARRENKLIFISSGYFACHWCHVMQRESFQDVAIASLLNRVSIPVKIDRELHPELDSALIAFVQQTRGSAGWPLNVFLTPQGYPLAGTVYLPPADFKSFVGKLAQRWQDEEERLIELAQQAANPRSARPPAPGGITEPRLRELLRQALSQAIQQQGDFLSGGLGDGAKFPETPLMEALLFLSGQEESVRSFTALTLEQIANQGLRDHLGGGFFRYTVDPSWQEPHFEKMLYDNAQLARLYLHAAKVLGLPAYREVALHTLDFMLRELWHRDGAFISSLSAVDGEGMEGGYYLWTHAQLQSVLDEQQYRVLASAWTLHGASEWQGAVLPIPAITAQAAATRMRAPLEEVELQLRRARQALLRARHHRGLPRDEKRLAGWNGLALSALSEASSSGIRYREAGRKVRDYLHSLWDGERLWRLHIDKSGEGIPAALEDYVYTAQGLLDWAIAVEDQQSRDLAVRLVREAWERFHDENGWHRGEGEAVRVFSPPSPMLGDGPLPSPSALWLRLKRRLGQPVALHASLLTDWEALLAQPLAYPSLLLELEQRRPGTIGSQPSSSRQPAE